MIATAIITAVSNFRQRLFIPAQALTIALRVMLLILMILLACLCLITMHTSALEWNLLWSSANPRLIPEISHRIFLALGPQKYRILMKIEHL